MSIRTRLLILAVFTGLSIATVTILFSNAIGAVVTIDHEKEHLTTLADSVRDVSIVVNSLDSAEYRNVNKKLQAALERKDQAFADLSQVTVLPKMSDDLKKAFEIITNMRALMDDDLKTLNTQYAAMQADLEKYLLESNSTTIRQFYTNDRIRTKFDLKDVYKRIDDLVTLINGLTETLAGVSDTIQSQTVVINEETGKIRDQSLFMAVSISGAILVVIVLIAFLLGTSISRRVKTMQSRLVPVSQGDFSQDLPVQGSDEVAEITKTVNHLLESLNRLLTEVKGQVVSLKAMVVDLTSQMSETTQAVEHIQSNLQSSHSQLLSQTEAVEVSVESAKKLGGFTENLSHAFTTQMEILSSSSSGIEQIIANIGSVNVNTSKAEDSSRILQAVSREGQVKLDLVAKSVFEISRSSENLVQVTAIINDIADKTNMLAMNASIEAAHAGNSGRGFGVVANEIRKLAEQAASQSKEISKDLHVVNQSILAIRSATNEAVDVFHKIVDQTGLVGSIVQEVQTSMDEQSRGGTLVLEGIHRLHEINAEVGQAVEEMKRGEAEILARIQELARQNGAVNANNEAVNQKTLDIIGVIRRTNVLAESTRQQIETLEAETNQFQTRSLEEVLEVEEEVVSEVAPNP